MMKVICLILGFVLLFMNAQGSAEILQNHAVSYELTGYVVDLLCGRLEFAPDGANMITSPDDHTVMCELLPNCLRSGYGVTQNIGTGTEKEYRLSATFDQAGNEYIVHLLRLMDSSEKNLIVKVSVTVRGTYIANNPASAVPSITSRSDETKFWPALNNIPTVNVDSLEFCNYNGPDSFMSIPDACSAEKVLRGLGGDKANLVSAGLCLREELSLSTADDNYFLVGSAGCADHATFKDIKQAKAATCNMKPTAGCGDVCGDACGDACGHPGCELECLNGCGDPLIDPYNPARKAKVCCLDRCGAAIYNTSNGHAFIDACGNPNTYAGAACPDKVGRNKVNECVNASGNPFTDACGNPMEQCCLDNCGNPLVDGCGFPFYDQCGNPSDGCGNPCAHLASNMCLDEAAGCGSANNGSSFKPGMPMPSSSIKCEGLVSACMLTMDVMPADGTVNFEGVPEMMMRRRRTAPPKKEKKGTRKSSKAVAMSMGKKGMLATRRRAGEPSVPRYTPLMRNYQMKIPKMPPLARSKQELSPAHAGVVGVAINGVPIVHEHPGEGHMTLLFDSCGGHGDIDNHYHYHIPPVCLIRMLGGSVPRTSDWWLAPHPESQWPSQSPASMEKSPLLGWALDGHPIFGPYNPDNGELVVPAGGGGDSAECTVNRLDECNGMVLDNGAYAYFLTPNLPFVPPCLMGSVAADAFVDNGLKEGKVAQCPFEGTNPLARSSVCEEKTLVFSDETCPGTADRQAIRQCFETVTSHIIGEPACADMEAAMVEAKACFVDSGCCHDWDATEKAWRSKYAELDSCAWEASTCALFGEDNAVEVTVRLQMAIQSFTGDERVKVRQGVADEANVEVSAVQIVSVSEVSERRHIDTASSRTLLATSLDVKTQVATANKAEAEQLAQTMQADRLATALSTAIGVPVTAEVVTYPPTSTPSPAIVASQTTSTPPPNKETLSSGLSGGVIVGIVAGILGLGVVMVWGLLWYLKDRLSRPKVSESKASADIEASTGAA